MADLEQENERLKNEADQAYDKVDELLQQVKKQTAKIASLEA